MWRTLPPWPEESVRSWIVKNALFFGMKPSYLAYCATNDTDVLKSDIDVRLPRKLLVGLSRETDMDAQRLSDMQLVEKRSILVPRTWQSPQMRWVLKLGVRTVEKIHYGQQICPLCWQEDLNDPGNIPFLRRWWRLAFFSACPWHGCSLIDRCPSCSKPLGRFANLQKRYGSAFDPRDMLHCTQCGFNMSNAPIQMTEHWEREMNVLHMRLYKTERGELKGLQFNDAFNYFSGLHMLIGFMMCDPNGRDFLETLSEKIGANPSHRFRGRQKEVELLPVEARSLALRLTHYMLSDWPVKFESAMFDSGTQPYKFKGKWFARRDGDHWVSKALKTFMKQP